jgi:glycosyltransferase involved in cell wall biosynthesis
MKLGIVGGSIFFEPILTELKKRFEIRTTKHYRLLTPFLRNEERIFKYKLNRLMKWADVVFFEWADQYLMWATQLKKKCKIITRLHAYELFKYADKIDWDKVDKIIFVNKSYKERFLSFFPNYKNKATVIYNFIDIDKFRPVNRTFKGNIGALGYINPGKRIYELILAFYEIKNNNHLKLYIAGPKVDGEEYCFIAIRELIKRLNLDNKVFLVGYIDRNKEDIVKWYNSIDIFISNSYIESFHVALHEAMACGCYPLAHFWEGVEEFVPKENIYITNTELKQKILDYCNWSEGRKKEYSSWIRKEMEMKFGDKKQIHEIINLIKAVGEET